MPIFRIAQLWCPSKDLGPNYDFGTSWAGNKREKSNFNDSASEFTNSLEMVKKNMPVFGIAQLWCSS